MVLLSNCGAVCEIHYVWVLLMWRYGYNILSNCGAVCGYCLQQGVGLILSHIRTLDVCGSMGVVSLSEHNGHVLEYKRNVG